MKIYDCHVHIHSGLKDYDLDNQHKNIIFNEISNYLIWRDKLNPDWSISLIFDYRNHSEFVLNEINNKKITALKIHTRVQKIAKSDFGELTAKLALIPDNLPVILDAFYYGTELQFNPNLEEFIRLIKTFPGRKFIIAHCGGYEIIKYFFHLRTLENVYYDLSLSLQYFVDSSLYVDYLKLLRYTPRERVMFGSDYPYASPKKQLFILMEMMEELEFSEYEKQAVLFENAQKLYSKVNS